jgi:hypothetical protein
VNQVLQKTSTAAGDGQRIVITTHGDSTSSVTILSSSVATASPPTAPSTRALENAVYGHIRAIRALGRTKISASEIATALSLPIRDVIKALNALRSKGVKIAG